MSRDPSLSHAARRQSAGHPRIVGLLVIAALFVFPQPWTRVAQAACDTTSIGVSVALADTGTNAYFCRGAGQVFLAQDTLIRSISIWRPAAPILEDGQRRYLFITETDTRGIPDVQRILLSGPSLVMPPGDGVHPVEYRFVFDPPFALPNRGKFFFDILADEFSSFLIPAVKNDPYPDGRAWRTSPVIYCDKPGYLFADEDPTIDLAFEIQFCAGGQVGTRRTSWGELKTIYR